MVTVNPRSFTSDNELIDAYKKILAPSLGHFLDGGMDPAIKALWQPVKLVGPALTVQTTPNSTAALAKAVEIAQPGDVIVMRPRRRAPARYYRRLCSAQFPGKGHSWDDHGRPGHGPAGH